MLQRKEQLRYRLLPNLLKRRQRLLAIHRRKLRMSYLWQWFRLFSMPELAVMPYDSDPDSYPRGFDYVQTFFKLLAVLCRIFPTDQDFNRHFAPL